MATILDCLAILWFAFMGSYAVSWFFDTKLHKLVHHDLIPVMLAMLFAYTATLGIAGIVSVVTDKSVPFSELRLVLNAVIFGVLGTIGVLVCITKFTEKFMKKVRNLRRNVIDKRRAYK